VPRRLLIGSVVALMTAFAACGPSAPDEPVFEPPIVAPLRGETFSFLVVGDYGVGGDDEDAVASAMHVWVEEHGADAIVTAGDNVYPEAEPEFFDDAWTRPFGWVEAAGLRVLPALGNHDVEDGSSAGVIGFFDMPGPWYQSAIEEVQVIVLDSNQVDNSAQTAWLRRTLSRSDAVWKVVVVHTPPYDCGRYGGSEEVRSRWVPSFERNRVALVLSGHDHNYQRFVDLNGVTYVVAGGGGDALYELADECPVETPRLVAADDSRHHFLVVRGSRARLEVLAIGWDGTIIDRFTLRRDEVPTP